MELRQLRLLLHSQRPPLRQRLQHRNTIGSSPSLQVILRFVFLLFLPLLRLRLELRQLRLLLHSQRPPLRQLLQHRNTIDSSLSRPVMLRVPFLLFLLPLRHLRLELRQLRLLLHSQRPPLRQRLQHRNTIGLSLSRPVPIRQPFLLFLPLRHLRLELRQLHRLLHSQRPPLRQRLQHRNTGGNSFSRPGPLRVPFLLFPFPLRIRVLLYCLLRRREHLTPAIPGLPETASTAAAASTFRRLTPPELSPTSSSREPWPASPANSPHSRRLPRHRPGHTAPTLRTRHLGGQPSPQPSRRSPEPLSGNTTSPSTSTPDTGITHTPTAARTSTASATSPSAHPADPPHRHLLHAPQQSHAHYRQHADKPPAQPHPPARSAHTARPRPHHPPAGPSPRTPPPTEPDPDHHQPDPPQTADRT